MILNKKLLLYTQGSPITPPAEDYPGDNTIWYWSTGKAIGSVGSPVSHEWDSETGKGILVYSEESQVGNFRNTGNGMTKIMFPDNWTSYLSLNDILHSNRSLSEIWIGANAQSGINRGMCNGGVPLEHIYLHNNNYYTVAPNNSGLILDTTLYLGTLNLDLRGTGVTTIGSRCMADMPLDGRTIYFGESITSFMGDYNLGNKGQVWTLYSYTPTAPPVVSWNNNLRGNITAHIPVGSLQSYQDTWSVLPSATFTFIEDL